MKHTGSIAFEREVSEMKKILALLLALVLAAGLLPVQAEENGGFAWTQTFVGQEIAGSDCEQRFIYRLDMTKDGAPFQTLYFTRAEAKDGGIRLEDVNFDGYDDLVILYTLGSANASYTFFLYSPNEGRFTGESGISTWLSSYKLYPEKQLIYNYIHNSALTGLEQLLAWQDGRLRVIRELEIAENDEKPEELLLILRAPDGEDGMFIETLRRAYDIDAVLNAPASPLDADRQTLLWQGL